MLLFQKRFHAGLVDGSVTLTFRLWPTPRVKPQGRYRVHPIGVVEVDSVEHVTIGAITEAEAHQAGFDSLHEMTQYIAAVAKAPLTPSTPIFRVTLHHGGDGDRVTHALDTTLSQADLDELERRLARLDTPTRWTREVLALIRKHPRTAASQLAKRMGRETAPFKADVVKLKKLGLTQSFEVGYELSPRGVAFLKLRPRRSRSKRRP